jgi:hypothetical protein
MRHHGNQIETAQRADDGHHHRHEGAGAQLRQDHVAQHVPALGAFHARRLHLVRIDRGEAGQKQDHAVSRLRPERCKDDAVVDIARVAQHRNAMAEQQRQQTKGGIVEPAEDQSHHHAGENKRREEQRLHQAHALHLLVQEHRHGQPADGGQQEQPQPEQIVFERREKGRRLEQLGVVGQADEGFVRHAVPGKETQVDRADDRVHHIQPDHAAGRRQEQERGAVAPERGRGEPRRAAPRRRWWQRERGARMGIHHGGPFIEVVG